MANAWFRMYSEFATDPKVQMMPEAMQRRYVMLLCLRCSNGHVTLHETELAFQLRISEAELAETKDLFTSKGLITKKWEITAWDKRQYLSDSSTARVAAHRKKKKRSCNVTCNADETKCNALDTDTDTDTDTEKQQLSSTAVADDLSPDEKVSDKVQAKARSTTDACPQNEIIGLYNEILPTLTAVKVSLWGGGRAQQLRTRWREDKARQKLDWWRGFFTYVSYSAFLTGRVPPSRGRETPFMPTLAWLINPTNFAKVCEGTYHNPSEEAAFQHDHGGVE